MDFVQVIPAQLRCKSAGRHTRVLVGIKRSACFCRVELLFLSNSRLSSFIERRECPKAQIPTALSSSLTVGERINQVKSSVIISTYNSPEWLRKVLVGYENQSGENFEVIVADDGSGPQTRAVIDEFQDKFKHKIKHVWQPDEGFRKCAILNKAILAAEGEYLIFTDGDCIPHPNLVEDHAKMAVSGHFLSGGYCKLPMETSLTITPPDIVSAEIFKLGWLRNNGFGWRDKWLKVVARAWGLNSIFDWVSPAKKTFNGNNSSCFRTDAIRIGGYDERMGYGGEDREFGYRLENAGIKPKVIRYSIVCLHLDHPRGYKNEEIRQRNEEIIRETRLGRSTHTSSGI